MKLKHISTEGLLECTQCGKHFKTKDMTKIIRSLYNSEIVVKCCPFCGSYQVEPVREQKRLEKYRYLNVTKERN